MPADVHHQVYIRPKFSSRDYNVLMKTIHNSLTFDTSDVAKFRLHVLNFFYDHGFGATKRAFGVCHSTLYGWKRTFEASGKRLSSLVPCSTRPHRIRAMVVDPRLLSFIRSLREEYGRISKYKLKIFLDEYARVLEVNSYGREKIGKIIKRYHYFFDRPQRRRTKVKPLSPRLRRAPREALPGYIEMDSITLYVLGKKLYFVTAIDVVTKFAWVKLTTGLTSREARKVLEEFMAIYTYQVREVQTDNGHEFLGVFDGYLQKKGLPHQFIYPRSPRINGVIERFNRTIQDEFLSRSDELYNQDWDRFREKLTNYLTWYNTRRPHHSLKLMTPLNYLQQFKV